MGGVAFGVASGDVSVLGWGKFILPIMEKTHDAYGKTLSPIAPHVSGVAGAETADCFDASGGGCKCGLWLHPDFPLAIAGYQPGQSQFAIGGGRLPKLV